MKTKVLSVGGSIIAPDGVDVDLLVKFSRMANKWLKENPDGRLIFVAGGGAPARVYQNAYRNVVSQFDADQKASLSFANDVKYFFQIIKTVVSGKNVYREEK